MQAWPPINAVRELCTKMKARAKLGETNVYIVADLKKCVRIVFCMRRLQRLRIHVCRFLLPYCPELVTVNLEQDSEERDKAQQKALDRRLELPLWAIAWDAYSLAAAALEQVGSF